RSVSPACGKTKRRQQTTALSFRNGTHLSIAIRCLGLNSANPHRTRSQRSPGMTAAYAPAKHGDPDLDVRQPPLDDNLFTHITASTEGPVSTFNAILIEKSDDGGQRVGLIDFNETDLMEGDVTVRIEWSTVNYKDGLALTGKAPVIRRFPMIAGIDFAGRGEASSHRDGMPGDRGIRKGGGGGKRITEATRKRRGSKAIGSSLYRRTTARAEQW